ncbi:WhiB family transcriptional regulator [Streptomyces hygroscopicus]|uniref:WhiB family transcriptional regulator n=1 Tax=Streptomyces hygroscopicus TaxID=1912 RepID=UPI000767441F|nr:WhiB family transcriptional regulator [Streptomyces hygroscopicus]
MPKTSVPPAHPRTLGDHTWQDRAACRSTEHHQVDPELFFPDPDQTDKIATAKALCNQCPVRSTCLDAALENLDRHGIRGGMTEEERRPLHKNLPRRLDYARVNAVLAGRDIHLTEREREAVALAAYQKGLPASRLAWLLQVTQEHADKLYRHTRRRLRDRALATKPKRHGQPRQKPALSRTDLEEVA